MIVKNSDPYTGPSFSIWNRLKRLGWSLGYFIFMKYSPRPFHAWRSFILRAFGAKIGKGVHIYPKVDIWAPWNLIVDDYVGIANGVTIYNMDIISIGERSVISQGSYLCGGSHDYNSKNFQLYAKPIWILKNVWVCAECFVHPGVSIAEGSVVGARSVVNKDLSEEWMVYSGNPAKKVGVRNRSS
jgi:putative colanic acid biosynthesis acetyltransferase WcaF